MKEQNIECEINESSVHNLQQDDCSLDFKNTAELVATFCGLQRTLTIGSRASHLVSELVKKGVDAYGLQTHNDASFSEPSCYPNRMIQGSLDASCHEANSFTTLVAIDCLEHIAPDALFNFLSEMRRVSARYVFLQVTTSPLESKAANETAHDRAWWEQRCFEAGFRKSPKYYRLNDYESLNKEGTQIYVLLEKVPDLALIDYSLSSLAGERDLHMDMMREVGERSDAHIIRYQWASNYIRPGDRVLDAACGLGYGGYVVTQLTEARSVLGIDGSNYAVDYASKSFSTIEQRAKYSEGYLPQALTAYDDGFFDTIISFETLEHVEDPVALLEEFHRILSPGGRLITSVPNDWSDETGEDPNPFHLHVYTWDKLKSQLSQKFIIEHAFQQIASGCKITTANNKWEPRPRLLKQVAITTATPPDSEWWLMVGIKEPVDNKQPYRESIYGYTSPPQNTLAFARDYHNPWLLRSMVEFQFRAKEPSVLHELAEKVLLTERSNGSPDEGAALAVQGYQLLDDDKCSQQAVIKMIFILDQYCKQPAENPHQIRWHISLSFLIAMLQRKIGLLKDAQERLENLAFTDCLVFSPTLGTKIVDAAYEGGLLSAALGDIPKARRLWKQGVREALRLLRAPEAEIIGDIEYPHQFSLIVAVEFLDSATRCVKALRWTEKGRDLPTSRLYEESQQCWKWMITHRTIAMRHQADMIIERDKALAAQASTLSALRKTIDDMSFIIDEHVRASESQTQVIEERWRIMQQMETSIFERDQRIASLCEEMGNPNSISRTFCRLVKLLINKFKNAIVKS